MLKYQDESGMWYQVVNVGGMDRNYLETSGSSIMAYALLKGVRLGFLPESYRTYGEKAFHGICEKYLSEDENGELHLDGICLVAGLGGANRRSGTLIIICPNRSLRMTQRALVRFTCLYRDETIGNVK